MYKIAFLLSMLQMAYCFMHSPLRFSKTPPSTSFNSLNMILGDAIAQMGIAAQLSTQHMSPSFMDRSFPISKKVTVEGMYKDYEVDIEEYDAKKDDASSRFKTAEQTEEGKNKYWAIFAVLVFGSFVIPMAQYYWYVAEETDFGDEE